MLSRLKDELLSGELQFAEIDELREYERWLVRNLTDNNEDEVVFYLGVVRGELDWKLQEG